MASAATPRILLLLSRAQEFHKMLLAILEKSKANKRMDKSECKNS